MKLFQVRLRSDIHGIEPTLRLADATRIGICAGGQFFGHGVEMLAGSATIRVKSLTVKK